MRVGYEGLAEDGIIDEDEISSGRELYGHSVVDGVPVRKLASNPPVKGAERAALITEA